MPVLQARDRWPLSAEPPAHVCWAHGHETAGGGGGGGEEMGRPEDSAVQGVETAETAEASSTNNLFKPSRSKERVGGFLKFEFATFLSLVHAWK